jgi:hypothetical protein
MSARQQARRDRNLVADALIDFWLDNTEGGRGLMARLGLSRDAARREIQALAALGLVRIVSGEPDAAGRFSLQIEAAVPANDAATPEDPTANRQQRRAAARRARP